MKQISDLVRDAGVVGAGGAGFPTHAKISSKAEYVIINGAECEPLLRVDQQLMAEQADLVIKGLEAVMTATEAVKGIVALKEKYKDAIKALESAAIGKPIEVFRLKDFFPAGDEQVTVYEVLGRVVPEGGIPLKVGCVVCNVETAINVAQALEGQPVTDTWLTVTGNVSQPVTMKLPVGVPIDQVLALAGVSGFENKAVIDGGPMMGGVLEDLSRPITKVTKGLIVLSREHRLIQNKTLSMQHIIRRSKSTCIQCAMCTDVCPRNLLGHRLYPHKIMRGLNYLEPDSEAMKNALLCCECGACELYGCIMQLSPRQVNAAMKKELWRQGIKLEPSAETCERSSFREYRKIPSKRLVARLGLMEYDKPAPIKEEEYHPAAVYIPLRQHIGSPAAPVVELGQQVRKGDLIAALPEGGLGANVHASISGTIANINDFIEIRAGRERGGK